MASPLRYSESPDELFSPSKVMQSSPYSSIVSPITTPVYESLFSSIDLTPPSSGVSYRSPIPGSASSGRKPSTGTFPTSSPKSPARSPKSPTRSPASGQKLAENFDSEVDRTNRILIPASGGKFEAVSILGKGQQGLVFKVRNTITNTLYAAKEFPIRFTWGELVVGLRDEGLTDIHFSLMMKHPNVVFAHQFVLSGNSDNAYIIMELGDMDIEKYLETTVLNQFRKLNLIFGACRGINYLHRGGFVHCDVKAPNALIKGNNLLISDFGLIRWKEDTEFSGCQTYNYKAPEFIGETIDEYTCHFTPEELRRWVQNQDAGEIWSFGIFCLEILYQKPALTWNGVNKDLVFKYRSDPYISFIKAICDDYRIRPLAETIIDALGPLPTREDLEILDLICNNLLILNQDQRTATYEEFLRQPIFRNNGFILTDLDNFIHPVAILPILGKPNRFSVDSNEIVRYFDIVTEWMFEVAKEIQLPAIVIMDAVDFFIQKFFDYNMDNSTLQRFACVCMYLIGKIYRLANVSFRSFVQISDYSIQPDDLVKTVIGVLGGEEGMLKYESLYSHLPSMELVIRGMMIQRRIKVYDKLGGPSGVARYLLETEGPAIQQRQPKRVRVVDLIEEEKYRGYFIRQIESL